MALVRHSTATPVVLSEEIVAAAAKAHREILLELSQIENREATGNARSAVTKPSSIPPWSKG